MLFVACGGDDFQAAGGPTAGAAGSSGAAGKAGNNAAGASGSASAGSGGVAGSTAAGAGGEAGSAPAKSCETSVECDDSDRCKGTALCSAHVCIYVSPPQVDDGNACTVDACDPASGAVTHTPVKIGDGDACTKDTCDPISGVRHEPIAQCAGCTGDASCDDGSPCTKDVCGADGKCSHPTLEVGSVCAAGNDCFADKTCDAAGECVGGKAKPAPAVDQCHTVTCTDGKWVEKEKTVDYNPKCESYSCDATKGASITPRPEIDDNDGCTVDACNATTGEVTHTAKSAADGDPCTDDLCDPATGTITNPPIAGCTGCSKDTDCDDGNPCTLDSCKIEAGKGTCQHPAASNGTLCKDSLFCNGDETCIDGVCSSGTPPTIDDGNACTKDTCDESSASVKHGFIDNGECCITQQHCVDFYPASTATTTATSCRPAGTCNLEKHKCVAGPETPTSDGNVCTLDGCDQAGGVTHTAPLASQIPAGCCVSAAECTGGASGGKCFANGTCNPQTFQCEGRTSGTTIDDGVACTEDGCDASTGQPTHKAGAGCCDASHPCDGYVSGDNCYGPGKCNGDGKCEYGAPDQKSDPQNCHGHTCDTKTGKWSEQFCCGTGFCAITCKDHDPSACVF